MVKDFCKENRKSVISFCALFALGIVLGIFITNNLFWNISIIFFSYNSTCSYLAIQCVIL